MNQSFSAQAVRLISHWKLWLLALLVGGVAGMGAVVFRWLIGFFHNLFFLGKLSMAYDANVHTPASPWGAWVILVPVVGAAGVAFLVKNFAIEAKGHGVPEVMDAIYYQKGVIRPIVALIKSVASALCIGSGGSVGREGPIVQIGSSFGSTVGRLLRLPTWERITLIAAGAGGGIAATFNTPVGGVLFATELLLHEVSVRTLVPVVICTATATYIGRILLGVHPSFAIPEITATSLHPTYPLVMLAYAGLGLFMGVVSTVFIKAIYRFEDFFEGKVPGNYYTRHLSGMLGVGIVMYLLSRYSGHYYVEGLGYATVQNVLNGSLSSFWFLLLLFGLKILATSLTLGSGGSGGIFSPSLFMGATFGSAYGLVLKALFPDFPVSPPAFAVLGMAGVLGGATGAVVTSIVMIFEMTLDSRVVLPMTITVAISYGVRKFLSKESIYTLKLARRDHYMPEAQQTNFALVRLARDVMERQVLALPASTSLTQLEKQLAEGKTPRWIAVEDQGNVLGVLDAGPPLRQLLRHDSARTLREVADTEYELISERTTMFEIVSRMHSGGVRTFLVTRENGTGVIQDIKGVISKERIADAVTQSI